jgi:hypothetical protein
MNIKIKNTKTMEFILGSPPMSSECPQHLKDWWESKTKVTERTQLRIEIYENYYEVNKIKVEDRYKINLRKQITKIK